MKNAKSRGADWDPPDWKTIISLFVPTEPGDRHAIPVMQIV